MSTSTPQEDEGMAGLASAGGSDDGLSVAEARRLAERAHEGQFDASGEPYIWHVRRVVAGVPAFARAVAWLHDVVERSDVDESVLISAGASRDQCLALRLLNRDAGEGSDDLYLKHVRSIALSMGPAGRLARLVKAADLLDHMSGRNTGSKGWTPPYGAGLAVLMTMSSRRLLGAGAAGRRG